MRELPKSVFGISAASLAVLVFTAGIVKLLWNELLVQSLSETAQRMSSGSASDFKSSAAVVAVGDVTGLGNEIHREFASALSEWKRSADYYVRLCLHYRESAIDELTQAISSQWHLRPSIEQVRDIASNGFAETISILQEQATKEEYKALFDRAARRVWRIAKEIRTCAEQLTSET